MILITGASDGLGLQLAKLYSDEDKLVVNVSRRKSDYAQINICEDISKEEGILSVVKQVNGMEDKLEVIINCAGVLSIQKLGEITAEEIDRVFDVNIKAQILLVSNLYDRIIRDETDIVNVASTVGTKGYKDQAVYGASKWAVRGFSRNLQEEFKGKPNRVISFCPGGFKSKLFVKATGVDNTNEGSWMDAKYVAVAIKQTLDLPKNMEVTEVIINRK